MIKFVFTEQDPRYLFLKCENDIDMSNIQLLREHLNLIDPICYLPTWGNRPKITQDFLWEYTQPSGRKIYYCAIGLWQTIWQFFKENNIPYDGLQGNDKFFKIKLQHTFEQFKDIVRSWNLKYEPRPYQYEAAYKILQWKKSTSQLATRAGKTLIAYMIFRYAMEYMGMKKILMIVPSIDLVKQAFNDFNEYAEFFKTECIWSGGKLVESSNITVGTFQSLIKFLDKKSKKYNPDFFNGYDCVFVDETHRATANQIKTIISQPFMQNIKIAFGMTGTLPKEHTIDRYCVHSLLGAKIQEINPKELMDGGYISKIDIEQVRLYYDKGVDWKEKQQDLYIRCAEYALSDYVRETKPNGHKEKVKLQNPEFLIQYEKQLPMGVLNIKQNAKTKDDYVDILKSLVQQSTGANALMIEKMMVHFMKERVEYLCSGILPHCYKNTLILAHHTEYIRYFTKIIQERFPERHVEMITGSVSSKERDRIKQLLKKYDDCILVASYGVMSTGITLNNLCFGVLFESFKSNVVNMQSLGRGLGLADMKDKYKLYDVIDCFDKKAITNKIFLQGLAKIKIYKENEFDFKINEEHIYIDGSIQLF